MSAKHLFARRLGELVDTGESDRGQPTRRKMDVLIRITASAPQKAEALMMARIIGAQCKERIGDDVIREITKNKYKK